MAATIAETADTRVIRWTEKDVFDESIVKTLEVSGDATDTYIEAFLDDYEAVTNVNVYNASVNDKYAITGLAGLATNSLSPFLGSYLGLAFTVDNPVNPSRPGRKLFKLRAPGSAAYQVPSGAPVDGITPDKDHVGTTTVDRMSRITGFLEDFLIFRPSETDPIVEGGFDYIGGQFATENRIADGDNLT